MSGDPDWRWTGGKPGEVTGTMWEQALDAVHDQWHEGPHASDSSVWHDAEEVEVERLAGESWPQIKKSTNRDVQRLADEEGIWNLMENFALLEAAGIPREWTGKVLAAVSGSPRRYQSGHMESGTPQELSEALRALYDPQDAGRTRSMRQTFLALLPEWEGSISDLVVAARNL